MTDFWAIPIVTALTAFVFWAMYAYETNVLWRWGERIRVAMRSRRIQREHDVRLRMLTQHVSRRPECTCGTCDVFWGPRYVRRKPYEPESIRK